MSLLVKSLEQQRENVIKQLKYLESGHRIQTNDGSGWVDMTSQWKTELEQQLADLIILLERAAALESSSN